jgi:hypothetical protein
MSNSAPGEGESGVSRDISGIWTCAGGGEGMTGEDGDWDFASFKRVM